MVADLADHPYTVVLTGGIAAGKTLISDEFAKLGVEIIDADVIARELVTPGRAALKEIEAAFGPSIIDDNGHLMRENMRALIFSDPQARKKLESILHPKIRQEITRATTLIRSAYCILVIPLFAENGAYPKVDRVLVVDVKPAVQLDRLMKRDKSNRKLAQQALASQSSRADRLRLADDIVENTGTQASARRKVAQLHQKYTQLAARRKDDTSHLEPG